MAFQYYGLPQEQSPAVVQPPPQQQSPMGGMDPSSMMGMADMFGGSGAAGGSGAGAGAGGAGGAGGAAASAGPWMILAAIIGDKFENTRKSSDVSYEDQLKNVFLAPEKDISSWWEHITSMNDYTIGIGEAVQSGVESPIKAIRNNNDIS